MVSIRDVFRKLGFADFEDEREDEPDDDEIEEGYDEEEGNRRSIFGNASNKTRSRFGGRRADEEDEPEEDDEEPDPRTDRRRQTRNDNVIRDSRMDARAQAHNGQEKKHCARIITVRQIEECYDIIQLLLQGEILLLNLENVEPKDCGRVVDLLSGAAFALQGNMIKVAYLSYLLAPQSIQVIKTEEYRGVGRGYSSAR